MSRQSDSSQDKSSRTTSTESNGNHVPFFKQWNRQLQSLTRTLDTHLKSSLPPFSRDTTALATSKKKQKRRILFLPEVENAIANPFAAALTTCSPQSNRTFFTQKTERKSNLTKDRSAENSLNDTSDKFEQLWNQTIAENIEPTTESDESDHDLQDPIRLVRPKPVIQGMPVVQPIESMPDVVAQAPPQLLPVTAVQRNLPVSADIRSNYWQKKNIPSPDGLVITVNAHSKNYMGPKPDAPPSMAVRAEFGHRSSTARPDAPELADGREVTQHNNRGNRHSVGEAAMTGDAIKAGLNRFIDEMALPDDHKECVESTPIDTNPTPTTPASQMLDQIQKLRALSPPRATSQRKRDRVSGIRALETDFPKTIRPEADANSQNSSDFSQAEDHRRVRGEELSGLSDEYKDDSSDQHKPGNRAIVPYNDQHSTLLHHVDQLSIVDPYGDAGLYTGVIRSGLPECNGTMKYNDGRVYTGSWSKGRWHGHGSATFQNGDMYTGEYVNDRKHGIGRYTWVDGRTYDGRFERDARSGNGVYCWKDGSKYTGEFKAGLRDGTGIYTFPDGSVYSGEWKDGKLHGKGEMVWTDGRCYRGDWKAGKAHGNGVEVRADGTIRHDGKWRRDRPVKARSKHTNGQRS